MSFQARYPQWCGRSSLRQRPLTHVRRNRASTQPCSCACASNRGTSSRIGENEMSSRQSLLAFSVLAVSLAGCSTAPPKSVAGSEQEIMGRVEALLDRYAANDQKGVIAMLDPNRITIFGSDLKEVVKTNDAVSRLMTDDFTLWHSAKFSDVRDVDVRMSDRMATTFFAA